MSAGTKWDDLAPRIGSAIALLLICGVQVCLGGLPFSILVWVACGLMTWELARMFGAPSPLAIGLLSVAALVLAEKLPLLLESQIALLPLFLAAVIVGMGQVKRDRWLYGAFAAWILAASYAFIVLRHVAGLEWFIWLVAIVIVSDIAGYFAGRLIGGPKFWPRISPKKTWSGTVAGWLGAAVIGVVFAKATGAAEPLSHFILISVLAAFAGQMGDIFESAVKRRVGVKDSSNLIPGHGGLLDRFDAMLGGSGFVFILWLFSALPGVA